MTARFSFFPAGFNAESVRQAFLRKPFRQQKQYESA